MIVLRGFRKLVLGGLLLCLGDFSALASAPADLNAKAVALMARGDYATALPLLLETSRAMPYEPVPRRNLADCYLMLGLEALQARDYDQASEWLQTGKAYAGNDPRFWTYRGLALWQKGDGGAAEVEFNEALAMTDGDPRILYYLAEVYYGRGELFRARQLLEEALRTAPEEEPAAALLQRIDRELPIEEAMSGIHGGQFVISCDGELGAGLGDAILDVLEDAYNEIGAEFGYYPEIQIPVLAYSQAAYHEITGAPGWSAGVYDGKIRIPLAGFRKMTEQLKALLYHEYTHVLLHFMARGPLPTWLNEGLAEMAGRRFWNPPVVPVERNALPWKRLERPFAGLNGEEARMAYEQSWRLTRCLSERYGRYKINELIDEVGRSADFVAAFAKVYGEFQVDYATFQRECPAMDPAER